MKELVYTLGGARKLGAMDVEDSRDYVLDVVPDLRKHKNDYDYRNVSWHDMDQGTTSQCTAYTAARCAMNIVSLYCGENVTFRPQEIIDNMGDLYTPGQGAYLRDAFKAVVKYGLTDDYGHKWEFGEFYRVMPGQVEEVVEKGFVIGTGSLIEAPMCDSEWLLKDSTLSTTRGGHAYNIVGETRQRGVAEFVGDNSWKNWGQRKHGNATGAFLIAPYQLDRLFTMFILLNPRLVV